MVRCFDEVRGVAMPMQPGDARAVIAFDGHGAHLERVPIFAA
jgi:hypothetical protein